MMTSHETLPTLSQILLDLEIIHSPTSTNQDRSKAQKNCDVLKEIPNVALEFARELLQKWSILSPFQRYFIACFDAVLMHIIA